jgi:hypothetical protein
LALIVSEMRVFASLIWFSSFLKGPVEVPCICFVFRHRFNVKAGLCRVIVTVVVPHLMRTFKRVIATAGGVDNRHIRGLHPKGHFPRLAHVAPIRPARGQRAAGLTPEGIGQPFQKAHASPRFHARLCIMRVTRQYLGPKRSTFRVSQMIGPIQK